MEYENGLDLGLGLSCGDSSSKTVKKDAAGVVIPTDDGDKDNVAEGVNDFFQSANQKQDAGIDNQQEDRVKSQGSFFEKLSMGVNHKSTNDHDDGEASCTAIKRKLFSDEMNDKKRHESEARHAGAQDRDKMSHISINTDDGSTAENEDVAESEVECSAPVSNQTTCKNVVEAEGTKNSNPSSDNEAVFGNMNGNAPYSVRPASGLQIPGYPLRNIVQMQPPANGERPQTSSLNSQMAFGYLPTQLPIFTRDQARGTVTRLQQPSHSNFGSVPDNAGIASERQINDAANENRPMVLRDGSRNVAGEAEASTRTVSKDKVTSAQPKAGISSMIKPGIAADIKFGGSGSCPNLPWVSTTGLGPNGKTISGVTYRFSPNHIKIVCACHGSHLTPDEFVRHANDECANQNGTSRTGLFPNNNPAASTQR